MFGAHWSFTVNVFLKSASPQLASLTAVVFSFGSKYLCIYHGSSVACVLLKSLFVEGEKHPQGDGLGSVKQIRARYSNVYIKMS